MRHVHIEHLCDAFFRDTSFDRGQDHIAFLNGRDPANSLVVCKCFVVGRDQARRLGDPQLLEDGEPQVSVEEEILALFAPISRDNERLYKPDLSYGGLDLAILRSLLDRIVDQAERLNSANRKVHALFFECHCDGTPIRFVGHYPTSPRSIRTNNFFGTESSFSAFRRETNRSSPKSSRIA